MQDFAESLSLSLFYASDFGNTELVKLLLDENADVNATIQVCSLHAGTDSFFKKANEAQGSSIQNHSATSECGPR